MRIYTLKQALEKTINPHKLEFKDVFLNIYENNNPD
jgi:hypothetical protein